MDKQRLQFDLVNNNLLLISNFQDYLKSICFYCTGVIFADWSRSFYLDKERELVQIDSFLIKQLSTLRYNWQFYDNRYSIVLILIDYIQFYDYDMIYLAFRRSVILSDRRKRLKARLSKMLQKDCVFLTLTFNESNINKKDKSRYVKQYLNLYKTMYVANLDYGEVNGRLHYHAIIQTTKVNYKKWTLGSINGKKIKSKNALQLSRYIIKLTNHATKTSANFSKVIYSKKNKKNT